MRAKSCRLFKVNHSKRNMLMDQFNEQIALNYNLIFDLYNCPAFEWLDVFLSWNLTQANFCVTQSILRNFFTLSNRGEISWKVILSKKGCNKIRKIFFLNKHFVFFISFVSKFDGSPKRFYLVLKLSLF